MDERDRDWRDRDWRDRDRRRSEEYGRGRDERRWAEDRSWSADGEAQGERGDDERDRGRRPDLTTGGAYGRDPTGSRGRYGGQARFVSQDYTSGGPAYDVERRSPPRWRDDYDRQGYHGQDYGGPDYGGADHRARGYDERESAEDRAWDSDRESAWARYSPDADEDDDRRSRRDWRDERGDRAGDFFTRAGERISSWFRGSDLIRGSHHDEDDGRPRRYREDFGREARPIPEPGHRGRGPRGYRRSDERINDEVHDRLTDDPWLDASNIEVQVKDGEVTLNGAVDNREGKHRAERLVEDISGVGHVQNNLRVNPDLALTGAGHGYGSSVLEAEMRREAYETDPGNNGASGLSGRTSTGAAAEPSRPPKAD
jgi:hypothetical protein